MWAEAVETRPRLIPWQSSRRNLKGGKLNRQGPGKIEWTDYTWSPVTGCKHGCPYCYARKIAQRIYPEKFEPTRRPTRLNEPFELTTPSKIFVCDMGDLFGAWVPNWWIRDVLTVAICNPQHIFQFLTKNPARYKDFMFPPNCWLGATEDCHTVEQPNRAIMQELEYDGVKFLSCEPLLGKLIGPIDDLDWIIVGEQTKRQYSPTEWEVVRRNADHLLKRAHLNRVARFVKNDLKRHFQIQEWPGDQEA